MPSLDLGTHRLEYSVVRGTSRRYTYFRFRDDLTLEIVVPRGIEVDVEKIATERSSWLRREYNRLAKTSRVLTRDTVLYGGEPLRVVFVKGREERLVPDLEKKEVLVYTDDERRLRELVRRWFLKESSAYAVKSVTKLVPVVGAKPSRVDVREMGKWGYCTRDGRLSFSWQLIALPDRLREYVVLHELTHLVEFNHSSAFKRKLGAVCPDFRARERELNLIAPFDRLTLY